MNDIYKEFIVSKIFKKINIKRINAQANDFPLYPNSQYRMPLLTAGINNQGLSRYATEEQCESILSNVLTISANGENSGTVFYQPYNFAVLQDAYAIELIDKKIDSMEEGIFLATALNKSIKETHNWSNKAGWNNIKNNLISLPIKVSNKNKPQINKNKKYHDEGYEPDFDYMYEYIKKIKTSNFNMLEKKTKELNLNNYKLTSKDAKMIKAQKRMHSFKLQDIFSIEGTKSLDAGMMDFVEHGINFVGRISENNGIQGKIKKQVYEPNNSNTITATVIGNYKYVKYQSEPYYCSQNINKLTLKLDNIMNENIGLYFVAQVQKFVSIYNGQQGGYTLNDIKNHLIKVPIKDNIKRTKLFITDIDFDFIEKYIQVLKKKVVKSINEFRKL